MSNVARTPSSEEVKVGTLDLPTKRILLALTDVETVAATGSTQADGAPLTAIHSMVTGSNGTLAVVLVKAKADIKQTVLNTVAASALPVFPFKGDAINALAVDGVFTVAAGKKADFYCDADGHWYTATTD